MTSFVEMRNLERMRVKRPPGEVETLREAWELACEDADDACEAWFAAAERDRATAYHAYVAASDREAAAAQLLRCGAARPSSAAA
jgi:hypothetical protein